MFVYIPTGPSLFTVGFFAPSGEWFPESDHASANSAAERTHWLNGGCNAGTAVLAALAVAEEVEGEDPPF